LQLALGVGGGYGGDTINGFWRDVWDYIVGVGMTLKQVEHVNYSDPLNIDYTYEVVLYRVRF